MNRFANFRVEIEGMPIHFVHERGKGPNPIPIILSHGWPWTYWDLRHVIGPLTDPEPPTAAIPPTLSMWSCPRCPATASPRR